VGATVKSTPLANRFERNFATNAALTKEFIGAGIARSRFGPADSWVIKASAHFPMFVLHRGTHFHELRKSHGHWQTY
jgi:hypothetical protein